MSADSNKTRMNYGELKNDKAFVTNSENLGNLLDKIDEDIQAACDFPNYENLPTEDKVKFDLCISYSINSLYWMLCKLQADDAGSTQIKNEISRVRAAMMRDKEIYERKTLRPRVDKDAAKRFIRHGLYDANKPKDQNTTDSKKRKRESDDDDK